jgi:hypothetical protein
MDETVRRQLAILLTLAAAGCAVVPRAPEPSRVETPDEAQERRAKAAPPTYNLTGYPLAVREGYIDGCESAKSTPYARKDAQRMSGDPQYSMGWNDGYSICKAK